MKIRDYKMISLEKATITVRKDENHYRSTYSVCFFSVSKNVRTTCSDRKAAKAELIRLLTLYTQLSKTEILRIRL